MNSSHVRFTAVALGLALGLLTSLPAAAQWKWKDSTGKVQYSDRPPPGNIPERDILQTPLSRRSVTETPAAPAPASAAAASPKASAPGVDSELEARRKKEEQEQEAKRKAEEEKVAKSRAENCERARNYQQSLDSGMRIARTNDKGEREILDDQARAQEMERAKKVIASDCGK
jgi:hypothetical protein